MKQRKFKFSLGMKLVSILSCVALVSVGFASWWIIQYPEPKTLEDGAFEVYAVDEKKITFPENEMKFVGSNGGKIIFGTPNPAVSPANNWLGYDSTKVEMEQLSSIFQFKVEIDDTNADLQDFVSAIKVEFDAGSVYEAATKPSTYEYEGEDVGVTVTAVAAPKIEYRTNTTGTFAEGDAWTTATTYTDSDYSFNVVPADQTGDEFFVQVRFTFGWGSTTENNNPYAYYNADTYSDDKAKEALSVLGIVSNLPTSKAYTVKVSVVPGNNN